MDYSEYDVLFCISMPNSVSFVLYFQAHALCVLAAPRADVPRGRTPTSSFWRSREGVKSRGKIGMAAILPLFCRSSPAPPGGAYHTAAVRPLPAVGTLSDLEDSRNLKAGDGTPPRGGRGSGPAGSRPGCHEKIIIINHQWLIK